MKTKLLMVSCGTLMALLYGCDTGNREDGRVSAQDRLVRIAGGGVITLEKKSQHRFCVLEIGGEDTTVSFTASMEYPMHFCIPKQGY